MPRFEIRLESLRTNKAGNTVPDLKRADGSPEFRVVRLAADDEDHARALVERKEYELAAWQAPPERLEELQGKLDAHESDDPKVALTQLDRAHWFVHHQAKPYTIVDVNELEGR